jgi:hypothetical protein
MVRYRGEKRQLAVVLMYLPNGNVRPAAARERIVQREALIARVHNQLVLSWNAMHRNRGRNQIVNGGQLLLFVRHCTRHV